MLTSTLASPVVPMVMDDRSTSWVCAPPVSTAIPEVAEPVFQVRWLIG
jgi:hypothetical protein